ncbi:MAG: hypothetical protein IPG75_10115 [Gemmatimonadetes bacterium]|nr:hypothetical protein [Gemmatimonadota bacterium]
MPLLVRRPPVQILAAPIDQRVRHACWATVIILAWSLVAESAQRPIAASLWTLIALALPAALLYLYWRRSRIAAVALPTFFLGMSAIQLFILHEGVAYFQLAVLGWFLARGSSAIFEHHRGNSGPADVPSV